MNDAAPAAIEVTGVSKAFLLPHQVRSTFKEHFLHPFHRTDYEQQSALDDITFSVGQGEFFGIVGPTAAARAPCSR